MLVLCQVIHDATSTCQFKSFLSLVIIGYILAGEKLMHQAGCKVCLHECFLCKYQWDEFNLLHRDSLLAIGLHTGIVRFDKIY